MTEQEETTIKCPNCPRIIYQEELCVCQDREVLLKLNNQPLQDQCPTCGNSGYSSRTIKGQIKCANEFHKQ